MWCHFGVRGSKTLTPVHDAHRTPVSKKIAFFEKVVKKNRRQSVFWRLFLTLSVYNFFTRISVQNFASELLM